MAANNHTKYDEDFKKSLVSLYQNGKTQSQLCKEYGVSQSALGKWIRQYSTVEMEDGDLLTARQVKELQKRNAQLEEENLILKKAIAIFTPHSDRDQMPSTNSAFSTASRPSAGFLASTEAPITSTSLPGPLRGFRKTSTLLPSFSTFMLITTSGLAHTKSHMFLHVIMASASASAECTA